MAGASHRPVVRCPFTFPRQAG